MPVAAGQSPLTSVFSNSKGFSKLLFSQFAMAAHIHRHAAALFDPLHLTVPERGLQIWAVQLHRQLCDAMRPAEGAGLKRFLNFVVALSSRARGLASTVSLIGAGAHMAWDVE